jgi:hypothetical protein
MTKPNRKPNVTCILCGTPMYRKPWVLAKGEGKYCSRACRNKAHPLPDGSDLPPPKFGAENPAWKGGAMLRSRHGNCRQVRYVRCPKGLAAMARADGYVMEHRLVMALWCGRSLTRQETVHHINHASLDNCRTNLELWPDNRSHKLAEHGRFVEGAANLWFP